MRLGAVLMASGAGRRFGGNKLLHPVDGVPMIERAMANLPAVFPRKLFPELLALTGDRGGGGVIRANQDRLRLVEASEFVELQDVDAVWAAR